MLCFHAAQTGKHLLRTQNVCEQNQKQFLCPGLKICVRNKCCARGQTGEHLCLQQCVLVCQGLSQFAQPKKHHEQQCVRNNVSSFASTLSPYNEVIKRSLN